MCRERLTIRSNRIFVPVLHQCHVMTKLMRVCSRIPIHANELSFPEFVYGPLHTIVFDRRHTNTGYRSYGDSGGGWDRTYYTRLRHSNLSIALVPGLPILGISERSIGQAKVVWSIPISQAPVMPWACTSDTARQAHSWTLTATRHRQDGAGC